MMIPAGSANVIMPAHLVDTTTYGVVTFGVDTTGWSTGASDLADSIMSTWQTDIAPLTDTSVFWGPCHVQANFGAGVIAADGAVTQEGGVVIASPPPNTAVLISKNTDTPGRIGRGRMYLPWAADESTISESGTWDSGAVANLQDAMNAWLLDLGDAGHPMVLLHSTSAPTSLVTSLTVQSLVATQRRRLRR